MEIMKIIGRNLKKYRNQMGLTQDQLATYLGVERSTISHYETAEREASLGHLSRLADLFGIELEELSETDEARQSAKLAFAFRRDGFDERDMESIASFQKIVRNYLKMNEILKNDE
ncbi:MAG: helix-turn-helix domain-containing protein [Bacteroidetes bacterium]|nr:helix-turn-helix domain-containing protein [Bacteroidota bacterium]MBU1718687.1 helix-turn-helix domain-containing protein [Bacteroidota bacterium]